MTSPELDRDEERQILRREDAAEIANRYSTRGPEENDPLSDIPNSLLSTEHIVQVVEHTGAVAPFFVEGSHSRLKMASYEGRIGETAYWYNDKGRLERLDVGEKLSVPRNSIVFVECDLDFRLPPNIALRFNLQIRHVHRGLLLGTGPLVDPGYWGKLCIPIHNLTDEDYFIDNEDGLIWVEFSKTSASSPDDVKGRKPLDKQYWEIREFVERAARPRTGPGQTVPIRSSIAGVRDQATDAVARAKSAQSRVGRIAWGAGILGAIAFLGTIFGLFSFIQNTYSSFAPRIDGLQARVAIIEGNSPSGVLKRLSESSTEVTADLRVLQDRVKELEKALVEMVKANGGAANQQ